MGKPGPSKLAWNIGYKYMVPPPKCLPLLVLIGIYSVLCIFLSIKSLTKNKALPN